MSVIKKPSFSCSEFVRISTRIQYQYGKNNFMPLRGGKVGTKIHCIWPGEDSAVGTSYYRNK